MLIDRRAHPARCAPNHPHAIQFDVYTRMNDLQVKALVWIYPRRCPFFPSGDEYSTNKILYIYALLRQAPLCHLADPSREYSTLVLLLIRWRPNNTRGSDRCFPPGRGSFDDDTNGEMALVAVHGHAKLKG